MNTHINENRGTKCDFYKDSFDAFIFTQPTYFSIKNYQAEVSTWVELLDHLCAILMKKNSEKFEEFLDDEKRRRIRVAYLSKEEQKIHFAKYLVESNLYLNQKIDAPRSAKLITNLLNKFDEETFELYVSERAYKKSNMNKSQIKTTPDYSQKKTRTANVTKHAKKRAKERCGINNRSTVRMATKILEQGVAHKDCSGQLKRWVDKVYLTECKANNIRLYGDKAYLFRGNKLITIIQIPNNLLNRVKTIQKRKSAAVLCS